MSELSRELDRLRERLTRLGGRCVVCSEWPTVRHEGYQPPEVEPDECPAVCLGCGYRPLTVAYISNWRGRDA